VLVLYSKSPDPDDLFNAPPPTPTHARRVARPRTHNWYQKSGTKKDRGDKPPGPAQCGLITLDFVLHNRFGCSAHRDLTARWTILFHVGMKCH